MGRSGRVDPEFNPRVVLVLIVRACGVRRREEGVSNNRRGGVILPKVGVFHLFWQKVGVSCASPRKVGVFNT